MDKPIPHSVREARQTYDLSGAAEPVLPATSIPLRAKVFKSGNSLALRLPKVLGMAAGMELEITAAADGSYALRRVEPPKDRIDVSGFAGKCPWLQPLPRELREFDERPSTIARRKLADGA